MMSKFKTLYGNLLPSKHEASMMCTIYRQSFYTFTKNAWIGNLVASCHITKNNAGFYDVTDINELVEGSSDSISATKKVNFV